MSNEQAIKEIELSIQQAKMMVEVGNALDRLRANRDFKTIIGDGYFEQEAIRLVHLKADPSMQTVDSQGSIVKQMDAIGALKQYFQTLYRRANMAEKAIEADEESLEEMAAEGLAQ